jgi:2-hydroxy-3-oxopropionate reductase
MGRPMAGHLQRAGHPLFVWARRPESVGDLAATRCATPAELGRCCDVVFTVVTSSADVEGLALGQDGLIEGMAPGSVLIDCSTIAPDSAREIAARLGEKGIAMLDAPVSGGEQGAIDATLAIMVGGEAAVLERVLPLLECLGQRIVHIGPNGAGQVAKACNQMIMVAAIQAAAEAMRLGAASGVDCAKLRQALAGGSAASRVLDVMGERMVERDFSAGIEARLHHKDFGLVLEAGRKNGVPMPLTAAVGQQLNALMAQGWGRDDTSSLLRVLEI